MCAGQYMDMTEKDKAPSLHELGTIHRLKTAEMIKASSVMGCIAGSGDEKQIAAAEKYAEAIGIAFQIKDDLLDLESTAEELGKSAKSDIKNCKVTFDTVLGPVKCRELILEKTHEAKETIEGVFNDTAFLIWLADLLADRKN